MPLPERHPEEKQENSYFIVQGVFCYEAYKAQKKFRT